MQIMMLTVSFNGMLNIGVIYLMNLVKLTRVA
jgi:hypothetical protein